MSDFNISSFASCLANRYKDTKSVLLSNAMEVLNLNKCNSVINEYGRILDLIFCNQNCIVGKYFEPLVPKGKQHPALEVHVNFKTKFNLKSSTYI